MGCQKFIVLTAFLLFAKDSEVTAQYSSFVEYLPAATTTGATPAVQSGGQYILPAIIQPIVPTYDSYAPGPAPGYPGCNSPAPYPCPPIIIDNGSDIWQKLLYFIILALQNKQASNTPPAYNNGCSCSCCCCNASRNACSCRCCNCKSNEISTPTYIPIPIAIPIFPDGYPCCDSFDLSDEIIIQPSLQATNGRESNEISFTIRAD